MKTWLMFILSIMMIYDDASLSRTICIQFVIILYIVCTSRRWTTSAMLFSSWPSFKQFPFQPSYFIDDIHHLRWGSGNMWMLKILYDDIWWKRTQLLLSYLTQQAHGKSQREGINLLATRMVLMMVPAYIVSTDAHYGPPRIRKKNNTFWGSKEDCAAQMQLRTGSSDGKHLWKNGKENVFYRTSDRPWAPTTGIWFPPLQGPYRSILSSSNRA